MNNRSRIADLQRSAIVPNHIAKTRIRNGMAAAAGALADSSIMQTASTRRLQHRRNTEFDNMTSTELLTADISVLCREISIIGLRYVVQPAASTVRRLVWILLLLGGSSFTLYQIYDRIVFFSSRPTNVGVRVEHADSIRFPSTTVCSENRAQKTSSAKYGEKRIMRVTFPDEIWLTEVEGVTDIIKFLFPPVPYPDFVPVMVDFSGYKLDTADVPDWSVIYRTVAQPLETAIVTCQYNGQWCNKTRDFVVTPTRLGYCYTFNSGELNYMSRQPGASVGLQLLLYVQQEEYLVTNSMSAGFRVLLHENDETPLISERGFKVSPGFITQVAVDAQYFVELPAPFGDCNNAINYTQSSCLAKCQADYVISHCRCKEIYMPGDVPVCGPENMYKCSSPTLQNYTVNNLASQCQCPRQCRQLTYLHSISQAEYSNHAIEWALTNILLTNISADEIRRNYATLEVYFSELKYTYTETTAAYTFLALMCDVGGALGLVLGSTLLTFFELADLALIAAVKSFSVNRDKSCQGATAAKTAFSA